MKESESSECSVTHSHGITLMDDQEKVSIIVSFRSKMSFESNCKFLSGEGTSQTRGTVYAKNQSKLPLRISLPRTNLLNLDVRCILSGH